MPVPMMVFGRSSIRLDVQIHTVDTVPKWDGIDDVVTVTELSLRMYQSVVCGEPTGPGTHQRAIGWSLWCNQSRYKRHI